MARIDYNNIKQELKKVIIDGTLSYPHETNIEKGILFDSMDNMISIELDSRAVNVETISYGTRTRYRLLFIIIVAAKSYDQEQASLMRDTLISELEFVLMQNRTINETVDTSWLAGGQNIVAYVEDVLAFVSAGEIRLEVETEIVTQ